MVLWMAWLYPQPSSPSPWKQTNILQAAEYYLRQKLAQPTYGYSQHPRQFYQQPAAPQYYQQPAAPQYYQQPAAPQYFNLLYSSSMNRLYHSITSSPCNSTTNRLHRSTMNRLRRSMRHSDLAQGILQNFRRTGTVYSGSVGNPAPYNEELSLH